eukprot:3286194-Amphidinium_carterae.1
MAALTQTKNTTFDFQAKGAPKGGKAHLPPSTVANRTLKAASCAAGRCRRRLGSTSQDKLFFTRLFPHTYKTTSNPAKANDI